MHTLLRLLLGDMTPVDQFYDAVVVRNDVTVRSIRDMHDVEDELEIDDPCTDLVRLTAVLNCVRYVICYDRTDRYALHHEPRVSCSAHAQRLRSCRDRCSDRIQAESCLCSTVTKPI